MGCLAAHLSLILHIWATLALALKQEKVLRGFHHFSLAVWGIWLVPFLSGMYLAMVK